MFLTRMELKGFKSFAHKTDIKFKDGLTVIVGPNGSGKSNINDALKWVLGESSKKTLRASNRQDMIFTGSSTQGPADFAEVYLYFNNTDRVLDIEEDEVVVGRKSYRDKDQNEYFLNGELVRRKDVKTLFMDTGLGNTDLSIISQGSVSKVTEAKPLELKKLLDEAAGVSRYQVQKVEAINKLDKVSANLEIFDTKLRVLQRQIKPLKEASNKAQEYRKIKEELRKIELPLLKELLFKNIADLNEANEKLQLFENKKKLSADTNDELRVSNKEIQSEIIEIEKQITSLQIKQTELQSSISNVNVEGDEKSVEEKIKQLAKSVADLKEIVNNSKSREEEINKSISKLKGEDFDITSTSEQIESNLTKVKYELSRIETEENNLNYGTRKILENKGIFSEIYGVVDQIINYSDKYELAIKMAIGSKLGNVVVNHEETVKNAVKFLKDNKFGTSTFIPAEKVQPKQIKEEYMVALERASGFLGILDSFIKAEAKFKNVVSSLAGNILLFDNLQSALAAAKFINYRFMIVTLDGDIIYPGFTVKGGFNKGNSAKERKDKLIEAEKVLNQKLEENNQKLQTIRDELRNFGSERNTIQNEEIRISERLNYLETQMNQSLNTYRSITNRDFDMSKVQEFLDASSSDGSLSLEQITNKLRNLQQRKSTLSNELISIQEQQSDFNRNWGIIIEEISNLKLAIGKYENDIEKDNEILNKDYKMSQEQLKEEKVKKLKISFEEAEEKRTQLREDLSALGYVDVESIEKFEELEKEYNELKLNTDDLSETREKLLSTIEIMDKEMVTRIETTFVGINEKFNAIFKMLFRGGNAKLVFLEPDNILESGIEIIASAPGKAIKNLTLYSGGEKSLIALSLIFAINEVKNLPLLLLDEVEAALDEANVERFAKFAKTLNETTQLIIVSHRPGTMEKADYLYGVTMQKKGITNIYNVKLDEAIEIAD